jgi:ABC-type nitrate/sulfonate/bicarbonate transport system permease component
MIGDAMKRAFSALVVCVLAGTACGDGGNSTPNFIQPTPTQVTENFTGTVAIGGSDIHTFTISATGQALAVTLTSAGPPTGIFMGLGVGTPGGTPVGSTCTLVSGGSTVTPAGTTPQLSGTISSGSYCLVVSDVGNQTAPVTYAATVAHF